MAGHEDLMHSLRGLRAYGVPDLHMVHVSDDFGVQSPVSAADAVLYSTRDGIAMFVDIKPSANPNRIVSPSPQAERAAAAELARFLAARFAGKPGVAKALSRLVAFGLSGLAEGQSFAAVKESLVDMFELAEPFPAQSQWGESDIAELRRKEEQISRSRDGGDGDTSSHGLVFDNADQEAADWASGIIGARPSQRGLQDQLSYIPSEAFAVDRAHVWSATSSLPPMMPPPAESGAAGEFLDYLGKPHNTYNGGPGDATSSGHDAALLGGDTYGARAPLANPFIIGVDGGEEDPENDYSLASLIRGLTGAGSDPSGASGPAAAAGGGIDYDGSFQGGHTSGSVGQAHRGNNPRHADNNIGADGQPTDWSNARWVPSIAVYRVICNYLMYVL